MASSRTLLADNEGTGAGAGAGAGADNENAGADNKGAGADNNKEEAGADGLCGADPVLDPLKVVMGTAVLMIVFYVLGNQSAKHKKMYRPGTLPFLNLVGSAFLLCTLFDEEVLDHLEKHVTLQSSTERTSGVVSYLADRKQVWVLLVTLVVLVLSSAYSPSPSPSLKVTVKLASASDASRFMAWLGGAAPHRAKAGSATSSPSGAAGASVTYTTTIESNLDMEDVVAEIEAWAAASGAVGVGVTDMQAHKGESLSVGLVVAVVLNFALDGLMATGETCAADNATMIKRSKIGGFLFDNLILMMILGYQFTRSGVGPGAIWGGMAGFVLVFAGCMYLGLGERMKPLQDWLGKKEEYVKTITFAVVVYTIFVELMPEATVFRDFHGNLIDSDEGGVPQYEAVWMPIVFFLAVLFYRTFSG